MNTILYIIFSFALMLALGGASLFLLFLGRNKKHKSKVKKKRVIRFLPYIDIEERKEV
jgi:Na+-driven multidrug efflux pump